jgi:hypothetical protein
MGFDGAVIDQLLRSAVDGGTFSGWRRSLWTVMALCTRGRPARLAGTRCSATRR